MAALTLSAADASTLCTGKIAADYDLLTESEKNELFEKVSATSFDSISDTEAYIKSFIISKQRFTVRFYDYFGKLIKQAIVMGGTTAPGAEIAEQITVGGKDYKFSGWDLSLENISDNTDFHPIYKVLRTGIFKVDGEIVGTIRFTDPEDISAPGIPEKIGYSGKWEDFDAALGDFTSNAIYTPIEYTLIFSADDKIIAETPFTIETKTIELPDVPQKDGYAGYWSKFEINESFIKNGDFTIKAYYLERLSAVESSLSSGCYIGGISSIELSNKLESADIYYTTDGSEPSTESTKYTKKIPLDHDMVIKAIAVCDGYEKSAVQTFSYKMADEIKNLNIAQISGSSVTLSFDPIKGASDIAVYSSNKDGNISKAQASFNEDKSMAAVFGLEQASLMYLTVKATYPNGEKTARTEWFRTETDISSDCELISINDLNAVIDSSAMTVTNVKVRNKYAKMKFDAIVSNGAEYAFYPSKYSNTPYAENIVPLKEGKNVFYIKITASDKVTKKVYKITAYRNTKSDKPQIEIKDGKAYITAAEGAKIFYTTDNSPVNMMLAAEYSEGFEVCPGMIIRAVAAETGKDEVSDEAILSLENNDYKAIIDIIDCSDNAKYADYELNIVSTEKTDALLICAEYKGGRLAGLEMMPMSLLAGDNAVSKRFTRTAENSEFKLMLWNSAESMKPLALPQR